MTTYGQTADTAAKLDPKAEACAQSTLSTLGTSMNMGAVIIKDFPAAEGLPASKVYELRETGDGPEKIARISFSSGNTTIRATDSGRDYVSYANVAKGGDLGHMESVSRINQVRPPLTDAATLEKHTAAQEAQKSAVQDRLSSVTKAYQSCMKL